MGCSGSGKSTFSRKLREITDLPLIHLDNIWWNADRTHITRDEFDKLLGDIIQGDKWIIDGDYSRTYAVRINACDTVIFLDYSEEECMKGIIERVGKARTDIPWTENTLDPELVKLVQAYNSENRPRLYELFREYSDKQLFIFKSRPEAEKWLSDLSRLINTERR